MQKRKVIIHGEMPYMALFKILLHRRKRICHKPGKRHSLTFTQLAKIQTETLADHSLFTILVVQKDKAHSVSYN